MAVRALMADKSASGLGLAVQDETAVHGPPPPLSLQLVSR